MPLQFHPPSFFSRARNYPGLEFCLDLCIRWKACERDYSRQLELIMAVNTTEAGERVEQLPEQLSTQWPESIRVRHRVSNDLRQEAVGRAQVH